MENNYVVYHLHSDLSLLDSTTKFEDYITKALELGQKAICISEHGNIYNWVAKKEACDKAGIKYLHGVEVYLTLDLAPKIRDNYHTILIAKNMQGLKEINNLISIANQEDHFYFKPRITFEELSNISSNVIKISACLASPLAQLENNINELKKELEGATTTLENIKYNNQDTIEQEEKITLLNNRIQLAEKYLDKLPLIYDYYEIQPHINSLEQKAYNKKLFELSKKNNKPLIAGTDTHSLNKYKAECRSILQLAKGIDYGNEDEFDLTYKSYEELVAMFEEQGALPKSVYLTAINNTNVMADSVESFELDKTFKYPKAYDDDITALKERLNKEYAKKISDGTILPEHKKLVLENLPIEIEVLQKIEMCGFMLFMADLIQWCRENNIPVGTGRGSVAGSYVAYVLGITDVNPAVWKTVFSRFANESRKEIGDIDVDFAPDDREKVYNHMIEQFGESYTAYILAITTVSDKGCIDEIGRALSRKNPDNDLYSLESLKQVKQEYESNPEKAREDYPTIFYYFDGILNTAIAQSIHPAGMVVSPITLEDNYGVTYGKENKKTLQIDMEGVHEVSLVKYDILGLKNVGIIKDACFEANMPYPKAHEVNWNDQDVWQDMLKCPHGIFQFEGAYAFQMLSKYKPKSIFDMSLITAALRPSGASYRDDLMAKKIHKNPSTIIDDLLKDNYGYLIYQEDTIKFLQQICGLTGSEADNIRRAIGRKQKDRLDAALPSILEGYCKMSPQPREVAEEEAKQFLQIIEDSASYQFGYNHSVAYCMIGYLCAYLRYYYTPYFIVSYLNNAKDDSDIVQGFEMAKLYKIDILPPRFRHSTDRYNLDLKTNKVYKGVKSIKFLNEGAALYLYSLRDKQYNSFVDLLIEIVESRQINSRQMEILIQLQYFEEFGKNKKLLELYRLFSKIYGKKQIAKENIEELGLTEELVRKYATKESEKSYYMEDGKKILVDLIERPEFEKPIVANRKAWEEQNTKEVVIYSLEVNKVVEGVKYPTLAMLEPYIDSVKDIDYVPINMISELLRGVETIMPNESLPIRSQFAFEMEALGYISMTFNVHKKICYILDVDFKYTPKIKLYSLGSGKETWVKVSKKIFDKNPFYIGNVISCDKLEEKPKWRKTEDGFEKTDETEWWLQAYMVLSNEEWEGMINEN